MVILGAVTGLWVNLWCLNGSDRRPSHRSLAFEFRLKTEGGIYHTELILFSVVLCELLQLVVGVCLVLGNLVKLGSNTPDESQHEA